jgi:transposase
MNHLRVARPGQGRPRSRPERGRGDKAYSSRAIRQHLRSRGIIAVIPEPSDQQGHHKRRGSNGGRPVGYDVEDYKRRNVVERSFNLGKQWRGLATRYDKLALTYRGDHGYWFSVADGCADRALERDRRNAIRRKLRPFRAPRVGAGL